ncbi:MAG: cytochrome c [Gammaproteobacteria bacterium]|nr:cytochrome c [Gammaproteobacteria bacterium]MCP5138600.1 cytochrome c [Chromatiales bacterium]
MFRSCAITVAALFMAGIANVGGGAASAESCAPSGELRGDAKRGAPLHLQHCAACHGVDGKAEVIVMHMDEPPKDQSDPVYMRTLPDEYLYLVICRGGAAVGKNFIMPKFGDVISDQDIRDIIAWIRTFSGT